MVRSRLPFHLGSDGPDGAAAKYEYYQVEIPFERLLYYLDIQKLYALQKGNGKERVS